MSHITSNMNASLQQQSFRLPTMIFLKPKQNHYQSLVPSARNVLISIPDVDDIEYKLYSLTHKHVRKKDNIPVTHSFYLLSELLRGLSNQESSELEKIKAIQSDGIVMSLMKIAANHLTKKHILTFDDAVIKWSVSRIINLLGKAMKDIYKTALSPSQWLNVETEVRKIDTDTSAIVERGDKQSMLEYIDEQRFDLTKNKKHNSQAYHMLMIVEKIIRDFDRWRKDLSSSELTIYRRFASLLEILLDDTAIIMVDGEHASHATKVNAIFANINETTSTYGRKIDLLLDVKLELCSNEWKVENSCQVLKPQSKNLRVNAQILNHILLPLHQNLNQLIAMDFIGTTGYMYLLTKTTDDFFIAKHVSRLVIPKQVENLDVFKKTLFFFKDFLQRSAKVVKKQAYQQHLENSLPSLDIPSSIADSTSSMSSSMYIFSTPKSKRTAPSTLDEMDLNKTFR
ncbi:unnamed protein product [Absidia cylindrospora]